MNDRTPTLEELIDAYISLEKRIHAFISGISGPVCGDCDTPCCEPRHCSDSDDSAWLQAIRARLAVGEAVTNENEMCFLGETGCTLPAGRPIICTAYICDDLHIDLHDTPEKNFLYQVASSLLNTVVRRIAGDLDLTELESLDTLTPRRRTKLLARIESAGECMTRICRIWEQQDQGQSQHQPREDLIFLARAAPFAAKAIRFPWEPPNLSLAGR